MRQAHRLSRSGKPSEGAVVPELALVLPFLTLLFLVIVDLGMVIWEHQVVQNAARAGARFSALPRNSVNPRNPVASIADIEQRVVEYLQEEGITVDVGDITVTQTYPITVGGMTLHGSEVTVTYDRALFISGGGILPFAQLTLYGRSVFRNLY